MYVVCPNERVQQSPELKLCKKEAKAVLAALPLLGIPQLCFLANPHQPPRMPASTTICTGSILGMAPKPASWVTFPAVITMEKENSRGKRQCPKSSGGMTEEHTFVLQNIHGINSL